MEVKIVGYGEEGLGNVAGLYNIEGIRNPVPTMSHKELFRKKGVRIVQGKSLK